MSQEANGQKPEKKWYLKKRMFVVYAILALILIGSIGGSDSPSSGVQSAKEDVKAEPALTVTAFKMASDLLRRKHSPVHNHHIVHEQS